MGHLSASSYTRVTNCQKWSDFSWLKLVFSAQYGFSKLMPRIFKYSDIPNISFTPDKELNILIYRSPSYLVLYRSHTLLKMARFLAHPVHTDKQTYIQTHAEMPLKLLIRRFAGGNKMINLIITLLAISVSNLTHLM